MVLDAHAEALRKAIDCELERGIVECDQAPALLADQMVVVGAAGVGSLEPGLSVPDGDALGEPVLDQQIEHSVDARAGGLAPALAESILDLHGAQRARLLGEQLDDPIASPTAFEAREPERRTDVLTPGTGVGRCHPFARLPPSRQTGMRVIPTIGSLVAIMARPRAVLLAVIALSVAVAAGSLSGCVGGTRSAAAGGAHGAARGTGHGSHLVKIVAAESFWGAIAAQLGGSEASVQSIIANPAQDPHSYEPTPADARALASAQLVIVNGIGYDPWVPRLLAANPDPAQAALTVGGVLGVKEGQNPHRWYDPTDVEAVARTITADLERLDPRHASYYDQRQSQFEVRCLARYHALIASIASRYAGEPVGASESIFALQAPALGLRLLTPSSFMNAISEGTEVTARDTLTTARQITDRQIKLWIYNSQNATPQILQLNALARAQRIPVVAVTETLSPAGDSFEQWQVAQLQGIAAALHQATGR